MCSFVLNMFVWFRLWFIARRCMFCLCVCFVSEVCFMCLCVIIVLYCVMSSGVFVCVFLCEDVCLNFNVFV